MTSIEWRKPLDRCLFLYALDKKIYNLINFTRIRAPPMADFVEKTKSKKSEEIMKNFSKNQKYFLVVAIRLPQSYLECVIQRKERRS